MPGRAKTDADYDEGSAGRFYSALLSLSGQDDTRRTFRRKVLGKLDEISAKIRAYRKKSTGLTGHHPSSHQIVVLTYRINDEHVIKVRDIQRGLGFTAGGVTRRLDAMVRDGLIIREPDPEDGRALLARLSPAGVALAELLLKDADERGDRLEQAFTLKEWQTLSELLDRLAKGIG